jgi:hypothetical protein
MRLLNNKRRANLCFITRHPVQNLAITIAYLDFEQAVAGAVVLADESDCRPSP